MNPKRRVRILGINAIIYGIVSFFLIFLILWVIGWFASNLFGASATPIDALKELMYELTKDMKFLPVFIMLLFFSSLYIIGGIGLLYYKNWGRIILIVASVISLMQIPIGTIIGIIFLIYLSKEEVVKVLK